MTVEIHVFLEVDNRADTNLKYPSLDTSYLTHTLGAKINAVNLAKKLKSAGAMIFLLIVCDVMDLHAASLCFVHTFLE